MSVIASLALLLSLQAQTTTPQASWETLATEYDLAFEHWIHAARELAPGAEQSVHPAATWWARFEELSDQGEGKATLWLLANRGNLPSAPPAAGLLARVRRGGEADWVGSALFELAASREAFDAEELDGFLEERMVEATLDPVRARAALALAVVVAPEDAARAAYLRTWAAMLVHQGVDLAPGEELARADLDELAGRVLDAVQRESDAYFELAYRAGSDGVYYPVSGAPPDPEALWRPAIEELATRGSTRAQLWALSNAPWELDVAGKQRLRGFLEAVVASGLSEEELRDFGWQVGGLVYRLGLEAVEPCIRRLLEKSPDAARPGLLFGLGDAVCEASGEDAAQRERGLAALREVRERWPTADEAKRAEGRIFFFTNLVVGKTSPDFETADADGNAFKLSDYRGKVTVVDFWGFW